MIEDHDLSQSQTWKFEKRGKKEKISAKLPKCVHNVLYIKVTICTAERERGARLVLQRARLARAFVQCARAQLGCHS